MLRPFKFLSSVTARRSVYTVVAMFVFTYIAFDVLDLDLSDFPLKQAAHERVVLATEMPRGTEQADLFGRHLLRVEPLLQHLSPFKESIRLRHKEILGNSNSRENCIRGHRITYPLSASQESAPCG